MKTKTNEITVELTRNDLSHIMNSILDSINYDEELCRRYPQLFIRTKAERAYHKRFKKELDRLWHKVAKLDLGRARKYVFKEVIS